MSDDTSANWIERYVLITAELDEVEDVFCLGTSAGGMQARH
jgi:hypothetical protein